MLCVRKMYVARSDHSCNGLSFGMISTLPLPMVPTLVWALAVLHHLAPHSHVNESIPFGHL